MSKLQKNLFLFTLFFFVEQKAQCVHPLLFEDVILNINAIFKNESIDKPQDIISLRKTLGNLHVSVSLPTLRTYFTMPLFLRNIPPEARKIYPQNKIENLKKNILKNIQQIYLSKNIEKPKTIYALAKFLNKDSHLVSKPALYRYYQDPQFYSQLPAEAQQIEKGPPWSERSQKHMSLIIQTIHRLYKDPVFQRPKNISDLLTILHEEKMILTPSTLAQYFRKSEFVTRLPAAVQELARYSQSSMRMTEKKKLKAKELIEILKGENISTLKKTFLHKKLNISSATFYRLLHDPDFTKHLCKHSCECLEIEFLPK